MEPLEYEYLVERAAEYDAVVARSPDIDTFCCTSHWILPAHQAFGAGRTPWMFRCADGYALLMMRAHGRLRVAEPLEACWGLACPLVGSAPAPLCASFAALCEQRRCEWDLLCLAGIPSAAPLGQALVGALGRRHVLRVGPTTRRHVASLAGGLDGFLARRSRNFRRSLARAERRARELGIEFEWATAGDQPPAALLARLWAVEQRSWKARDGVGLALEEMRAFYGAMMPRLAATGSLRLLFARRDGRDVGYVLGAVRGRRYRGLQFSFDDAYRDCGLGNVCQLVQIRALGAEGVSWYDLGTGGDYKRAWAERSEDSLVVVVSRH